MLSYFSELVEHARQAGAVKIAVAAAQDDEALRAVKAAQDLGLADPVLVGDESQIRPLLAEVGLASDTPILHEANVPAAALRAAELVRNTSAGILMKGLVNSGDFLRAILDGERGLRTERLLSHFSAYEVPGGDRLIFHTDGGMNIAPDLAAKKEILINALLALAAIGVSCPNVAVLAANEVVNPKMQATVDAKALADMSLRGELPPAVVEGPVSMDVALSAAAAVHKKITSKVAGQVDLFVMPDIASGNIVSKALIHYAKFRNAGVILGATHPAVMVSRADSADSKLHSIALACCIAAAARRK